MAISCVSMPFFSIATKSLVRPSPAIRSAKSMRTAMRARMLSLRSSAPAHAEKEICIEDIGPINKGCIEMTDPLYEYILKHTRESPILRKVREDTSTVRGSQMQTPPDQMQLIQLLVELTGARRAIEVGVYTGYSAVAIAQALPEDGVLVACERDAAILDVACGYLQEAGVHHKVDYRPGPGSDTLDSLIAEDGLGKYDFIYIDADKRGYMAYYEQSLQLVRKGGLIALDNVLWYGKVADEQVQDKQTLAIRELNRALAEDPRITFTIIAIGDGVALCRKR